MARNGPRANNYHIVLGDIAITVVFPNPMSLFHKEQNAIPNNQQSEPKKPWSQKTIE
jgi:hypothetical protein